MRFLGFLPLAFSLAAATQAQTATFEGLGGLSITPYSSAYDVSADGSVVVGGTWYDVGPGVRDAEAFRWEDGVMTGLGDLPGNILSSGASAVSADGSVVVGTSDDEAFRWEDGVMIGLNPQGSTVFSFAKDVSADGDAVVGHTRDYVVGSGYVHEAFLWTAATGMVALPRLPGQPHEDMYATAISADGRVVVGNGGNGG